jgi:transcriptional regulator with XRE-family HTH domain
MAVRARSPLHARIGKRIRDLRAARGLTQAALAERVGCSSHFVSGIERGVDSPSLLTLERIADALDSTAASLVAPESDAAAPGVEDLRRALRGSLDDPKLVSFLREAVALYRGGRRLKK